MDTWPKISEIAQDVQTGKSKAVDMVKKSFAAIEKNKGFDALIATIEDRALKRATEIDSLVATNKNSGRLAGVPFIAKDNFLAFGGKTTAASNMLRNFDAPYQATAVEKLEAEGAICVAKSNLDAFAHGSSTENSDFFVTKNPHDKSRVPGGSSGGSAAAVVLSMAPFALGTDTGGSVRLPASFVGAVGFKPTYGLISRNGIIAMASSTDVVGPMASSVDDVAQVLDVIAGKDELDSTTIERDQQPYTAPATDLKQQKIGVIKEHLGEGLETGTRRIIDESIAKLRTAGAQVEEVSLPSLPLALAAYYIVCPAEVSSNLARYDGQRFGYSHKNVRSLEESYEMSRQIGFGAEAKRRIMIGTYVLSSGYYDAYYKKAQLVRTKIIQEFSDAFKKYNFLLGPTTPMPAFKIGARSHDPLQMYMTDIMTVGANMAGNPAISIPAGRNERLPVGLQFIAPMRADRQLIGVAKAFEEIL